MSFLDEPTEEEIAHDLEQEPSESRHGCHRQDKCLFSMWIPIITVARLRRMAADMKTSVTSLVTKAIGPLDEIELSEEDLEWMSDRQMQNKSRRY